MATLKSLKEAVLDAVAALDDADGSRAGSIEAFDAARELLSEAYGPEFEDDLEESIADQDETIDTDGDGIDDFDELAANEEE